ncbi:MAG TPA: hypothetical protein VK613_03715 [Gaiellaceae bacterium]|nr:hypothetical protein [Gaiellaceae bacterium]
MKIAVATLSVALGIVAGAQATVSPSGLHGVVMRGPITPMCVAEQPCTAPAKSVTLLFSRDGRIFGRTVTDSAGRYRLRLPAGLYAVRRPVTVTIGRGMEPNRARVYAGRFVRVDFSIDTGIR